MNFIKMHGLGNDFVILNAINDPISLTKTESINLANRHTGIGCDQLLLIESATNAAFFCRIFNADGSEAEQCGNGLRCVARYIHESGMYTGREFSIATKAGVYPISITDYDHITVTMGAPTIECQFTPIILDVNSSPLEISILSVGNPHAILKVDSDVESLEIDLIGAQISQLARFSQGANVGFMQVVDDHHIRLRTYERGSGETHACGSNACAATVAGISNGWLASPVKVEFRFGTLDVEWTGGDAGLIKMTGPATLVFKGSL